MRFEPYEPPEVERDARPSVIFWFRAYAALMTLGSLGVLGFGILMGYAAAQPAAAFGRGAADAQLSAIVVVLVASVFVGLFGAAVFVPYKPWGWTLGFLAIALGLAGGTIVIALPLLAYWMKPECKAAFSRL